MLASAPVRLRLKNPNAVTIRDDGTFDKDPIAEARRKYYDGIVINPLTGAVTHPSNGSRENWRAIQEASTNDYVLIPEKISDVSLRAQKDAATAVTDFIRVRVGASEPQVTFLAFSLSNLVTGTCEIVRQREERDTLAFALPYGQSLPIGQGLPANKNVGLMTREWCPCRDFHRFFHGH